MTADVWKIAHGTEKPLAEAIGGVRSASDEMKRFVRSNEPAMTRAMDGVHGASGRLAALVDSLSALSAVIDTLSTVSNPARECPRNSSVRELYDELRHTNASIDSL